MSAEYTALTEKLRASYAPGVPYTVSVETLPLPTVFFQVAQRYPQRIALDFMGQQTSYSQLARQIKQAARVLHQAGVKPGDRVGLTLPNCPQHIVALYAIMQVGAIAVETNPLSPRTELSEELKRAGAKVLIVWEKSLDSIDRELVAAETIFSVDLTKALPWSSQFMLNLPIPPARQKKAQLRSPRPKWARSWDRAVAASSLWRGTCPANADDVAILLHTGGTTGTPKGVMLTHANLGSNVNMSVAWVNELHAGAETFYTVLPLFHAFGMTTALTAGFKLGATLVLFPKFDVPMILAAQKRIPCTFFPGVAPMFDRILKAVTAEDDLSSIRFSLSGAMPLSAEIAAKWEAATGGLLIEGYGMTEASPVILGSPLSEKRRPGTLGLPFPSVDIRIANPDDLDTDMPEGEIGELLAKGPNVFKGYWDNPKETAEAFHNGWLRTGDLVQVVGGFVVMADRRKELIISGGFNIYPSQVEDAVRSMPGVTDVAVVGLPEDVRGEDVVAALTLEAGASVTLEEVRAWAEKSISHYALPRQIFILQDLPRSQIGKVMRRKVRDSIMGISESSSGLRDQLRVASENALEHLKASSEAAKEQLKELSEQVGEKTAAATAQAQEMFKEFQARHARAGEETAGDCAESELPVETACDTCEPVVEEK
ncbi:AMP-binding enzyme [Gleimia coleocanis DSM 15436]|uniref:AMP-binding enzyme n=1 Tax=Gleimia coleocanis DSM 15436 TaxID=525245 RepID=C0W0F9_9ACTO|nr:AMP-binding protein [Gleimia coleocanis]EEH64018.1 AMP-binding enzyme [Gleimia coleocanis DSM 15436]